MVFHYEDIFPIIGDLGPFQLLILFVVNLPCISVAIDTYSPLFTLLAPKHRCRLPGNVYHHDSFQAQGFNHSSTIAEWIPAYPDGSFKECCMYNDTGPEAIPQLCQEFVYDHSVIHSSASSEWNFVCSSRSLVTTAECVMWTGVMLGAVFFGAISDKFGRANAVNLAICANILMGVILTLSPHPGFFLTFLFLQGSSLSGLLMATFVLTVEHVGPSKRHLVSVINHAYVAIGVMILALLSHYIKDWRILQLCATATCVPCLLFFNRSIIPESPRWLFAKHRMEELYDILEKAAKVNGIKLDHLESLKGLEDASISIVQAQPATGRLRDIFNWQRPNFLGKTLIMFLNWFVTSVLYYGLTMQAGKISPSIQLNLVISGSVELAAYAFCALIMTRVGRRHLLAFSHFLSATALLTTLCFPPKEDDGVTLNPVVLALLMIGKFGASISFTIICIYSCEIFPTVVRSLGVGLSSCSGRLGGVMAPLIASIDQRVSETAEDVCDDRPYAADPKWSFVITGTLALLTGLFTLMLPETLNEPLPETCDDAEENGRLPCFRAKPSAEDANESKARSERSLLLPHSLTPSYRQAARKRAAERGAEKGGGGGVREGAIRRGGGIGGGSVGGGGDGVGGGSGVSSRLIPGISNARVASSAPLLVPNMLTTARGERGVRVPVVRPTLLAKNHYVRLGAQDSSFSSSDLDFTHSPAKVDHHVIG